MSHAAAVSESSSWRDVLVAAGILLAASTMSPFALVASGLIPDRLFYIVVMPLLALLLMRAPVVRVNPYITAVVGVQCTVFLLVFMIEGTPGHLKTIATLLSAFLVSVILSSGLFDARVFVRLAVRATIVVLFFAAASMVLAYGAHLTPIARFDGGEAMVYQVGLTLTNTIYPAGAGLFIRPSGVFAEPGQLGMYAILAMLANATILDDRRHEVLLIALGLFTTSLGFYLFLPLFFLLFKRWTSLALFGAALAGAIVVAGGRGLIKDSVLLDHVLGRFIDFFTDTFGGNRAGVTRTVVENLGEFRWLGASRTYAFDGLDADATLFGPFFAYGLLGGWVTYLHVALFALLPFVMRVGSPAGTRLPQTRLVAVFVVLAVNLFQRPFTLHFLYYVYLIVIFEWEYRKYRSVVPAVDFSADPAPRFA